MPRTTQTARKSAPPGYSYSVASTQQVRMRPLAKGQTKEQSQIRFLLLGWESLYHRRLWVCIKIGDDNILFQGEANWGDFGLNINVPTDQSTTEVPLMLCEKSCTTHSYLLSAIVIENEQDIRTPPQTYPIGYLSLDMRCVRQIDDFDENDSGPPLEEENEGFPEDDDDTDLASRLQTLKMYLKMSEAGVAD